MNTPAVCAFSSLAVTTTTLPEAQHLRSRHPVDKWTEAAKYTAAVEAVSSNIANTAPGNKLIPLAVGVFKHSKHAVDSFPPPSIYTHKTSGRV